MKMFFPKLDPKKLQGLMKQLGMKQESLDAEEVIIKQKNKIIIIKPVQVTKINLQGQEMFQINGEVQEQERENKETEKEMEYDIEMIMKKTKKPREKVLETLEKNDFDIAKTILELSK